MASASLQRVTITMMDGHDLSGLLVAPPTARACYVMAHGAGAGMEHPFMVLDSQFIPLDGLRRSVARICWRSGY